MPLLNSPMPYCVLSANDIGTRRAALVVSSRAGDERLFTEDVPALSWPQHIVAAERSSPASPKERRGCASCLSSSLLSSFSADPASDGLGRINDRPYAERHV